MSKKTMSLTGVILEQMKSSLEYSEATADDTATEELAQATDILARHQQDWKRFQEEIGRRKTELEEEVRQIDQILKIKKEQLLQLRLEYEKRALKLEEKHIKDLKEMEIQQDQERQKKEEEMEISLSNILSDLEQRHEQRERQQELVQKQDEMEHQLEEEIEQLKQQRKQALENELKKAEERLSENVVGAAAEEEVNAEDVELNCTLEGDIFTLYLDEPTLRLGSYNIIEVLTAFLSENAVGEFHLDFAAVNSLSSRAIELVLKIISTYKASLNIQLNNVRENFLETFQMLELDDNIPINTLPV